MVEKNGEYGWFLDMGFAVRIMRIGSFFIHRGRKGYVCLGGEGLQMPRHLPLLPAEIWGWRYYIK